MREERDRGEGEGLRWTWQSLLWVVLFSLQLQMPPPPLSSLLLIFEVLQV